MCRSRILPDRQISDLPVQPSSQKYFHSLLTQITCYISRHPGPHQGAFRDRHERRARDAMDAGGAADESAYLRTAKSCGPDAPTLASSCRRRDLRGDGGKQARSPGRARNKLLKPSRAGMPGDPGATVVTNSRAYLLLHARLRVQRAPGIPHALCWADHSCTTRAQCVAGMRRYVCCRHCERSEAIHSVPCGCMDCFARSHLDDAAFRWDDARCDAARIRPYARNH